MTRPSAAIAELIGLRETRPNAPGAALRSHRLAASPCRAIAPAAEWRGPLDPVAVPVGARGLAAGEPCSRSAIDGVLASPRLACPRDSERTTGILPLGDRRGQAKILHTGLIAYGLTTRLLQRCG